MHVRIESLLAKTYNDQRKADEPARQDTWEGTVPEMTLEEIFRFFNRVEDEDAERLEKLGYTLPSLSVGDTVTIDEEKWAVRVFGFTKVEA